MHQERGTGNGRRGERARQRSLLGKGLKNIRGIANAIKKRAAGLWVIKGYTRCGISTVGRQAARSQVTRTETQHASRDERSWYEAV